MSIRVVARLSFKLLRQPHTRLMPQLTLFSDPNSKSLSLSPQKAKTSHSRSASGYSQSGGAGLWDLHHEEEDMAAANRAKAKAKADGTAVPMNDEGEGPEGSGAGQEEGKKPKGQPGDRGTKRSHSPEGGGVAGSRDTKKHKNAYEISKRFLWSTQVGDAELMRSQRARSRRQRWLPGSMRIHHWIS